MTFFGFTNLKHKDPFTDKKLQAEVMESEGEELTEKQLIPHKLPPVNPTEGALDSSLHRGSLEKYKEIVKRYQINTSTTEMYRPPLTTAQNYGWWIPKDPKIQLEKVVPWIRTPRYPRIRSPMTKL
uniref:Testis-expressed protein 49 isoform X2 n=1 Tax=Geotrypetes seraphini TaxID=260995 RepID=A0A6P8QXA2_GEOSA|nr:testis-expressed protein 49 isoform X2 [Geotrypetes seraphini]